MKKAIGESDFSFSKTCEGKNHIWQWFGSSALDETPPPDDYKCKCGKVAWKDRDYVSKH